MDTEMIIDSRDTIWLNEVQEMFRISLLTMIILLLSRTFN
jgi:hypothetical protein